MREIPLDAGTGAKADANGIARARIGPQIYGHEWVVTRIVTTTNDFVNRNELRVYRNGESPNAMIAGTYNANQDFNDDEFTLPSLNFLVAVWSGCAPGTDCTLQLQGTVKDKRL